VKDFDARKRADAEQRAQQGEQLDKVLAALDALTKTCDALTKRIDALEGEAGDGKHPPMDGARHRGATVVNGDGDGKPTPVVADSDKPWVKADAERKRESELAEIQWAYDKVSNVWGENCPRYLSGEQPTDYRRRLARRWQRFCPEFKDVDLSAISDPALTGIEQRIRADAIAAASAPAEGMGDVLISRTKKDESGRTITEWHGQPRAWLQQFAGNRRRLIGIRGRSRAE
jgi:hypothetical protein